MTVASIPSPHTGTIDIGPLVLHMYGLMLLLAIAACIALTGYRWKKKGGEWDLVMRAAVWGVAFGVIGARLYHDLTSWDQVPNPKWKGIFEVWQGGLGIWGGILLGCIAGGIVVRRSLNRERVLLPAEIANAEQAIKQGRDLPPAELAALNENQRRLRARYEAALTLSVAAMLDAAAPGLLLAQGIGRWGNWWNQELFGKPTSLPWGLEISAIHRPGQYAQYATFHPTFLYEFVYCLIGVAVLLLLDRRYRFRPPALFALYISVYTFGRTFEEFLRVDPSHHIAGLRLNAIVSIVVFIGATAFFIWWQFLRAGDDHRDAGRTVGEPVAAAPGVPGASVTAAAAKPPRRSLIPRRRTAAEKKKPPKMAIPKGRVRPPQ